MLIICPPYSAAVQAVVDNNVDPYFSSVAMLLHMDGANNGTTFTDVKGNSITRVGTPVTSTARSKFGTASALLAGSTDALAVPTAVTTFLGGFANKKTTIEMWIYPTTLAAADYTLAASYAAVAQNGRWMLEVRGGASPVLVWNHTISTAAFATECTSSLTVALNQWQHIAIVIDGTTPASATITLYVNGVGQSFTRDVSSQTSCYDRVRIGGDSGYAGFIGNIDEVRFSTVARYTANFTPATAAFSDSLPNVDRFLNNSSLLMHFDGANNSTIFLDKAGHRFTIATGTPKISTAQSKFGVSSLFMDGFTSNGYISTPADTAFDITSGNFTISLWAYVTSYNPNANQGMSILSNFIGGSGWSLAFNGVNAFTNLTFQTWNAGVGVDVANSSSIAALTLNTWHHVEMCKSGSTYYFFIDGVAFGTVAAGAAVPAGAQLGIGVYMQNLTYASYFRGYLDDIQIVKGYARHTTAFIPYSTVAPDTFNDASFDPYWDNVVLSMPMEGTNGSTSMPDLKGNTVTVTGVTLSDITSRAGLTSALFAGNASSNISIANSANFAFGTGNFTIECWFNPISFPESGSSFAPLSMRGGAGTDGFILYGNPTSLHIFAGGTDVTSGACTWTPGTWYHLAVTRAGNVWTIWINGVQISTATNAIAVPATSAPLVIGMNNANNRDWCNGYIDGVRLTKGVARYTSAFTPVRGPYAEGSIESNSVYDPYAQLTTAFLAFNGTNGSTTFTDEASGASAWTTHLGSPTLSTAQSKYGTASLSLNGSSAIRSTMPAFATSWTMEFWANVSTFATQQTLVSCNNGSGFVGLNIWLNTAGKVVVDDGNTGQTAYTSGPALNTWFHLALVRVAAGTISVYLNGVLIGSNSPTQQTVSRMQIGCYFTNSYCTTGYIDHFRFTNGIARYSTTFTPALLPSPTVSEYTSRYPNDLYSANVSCCITFDTQTIMDITKNNVVTNTAVAVTTQTFVENAAGVFLGGTTKLTMPAGTLFAPGTGDFTVEMWVNATSAQIYNTDATYHSGVLWSQDVNGTNNFLLNLTAASATADPTVSFLFVGGSAAGPAINAGAWNHVALVRKSGVVTIYTNGVAGTPVNCSNDFNNVTYVPTIGQYSHTAVTIPFAGLLDNIRYTKGVARYTAAFSPTPKF